MTVRALGLVFCHLLFLSYFCFYVFLLHWGRYPRNFFLLVLQPNSSTDFFWYNILIIKISFLFSASSFFIAPYYVVNAIWAYMSLRISIKPFLAISLLNFSISFETFYLFMLESISCHILLFKYLVSLDFPFTSENKDM